MKNSEKLKLLLENEIVPDLESAIDELFSEIEKAKDVTKEQRGDLDELHQMKDEFKEILRELDSNELTQEEIYEILEALMEAKSDDIES
jgi:DNA-binding transcriptional regulator GbsR (MarR family)